MKRALPLLGLLLALTSAPAFAAPQVPTQLPSGVEPVAYELAITPDATKLTLAGQVRVTVQVTKPVKQLVLNALGLTIGKAVLDDEPAAATLDARAQTAAFATGKPIAPGSHVLVIDYAAKIADSPTGLFHVDYVGGRMLATQFEPSDARRFMPVFDEPSKKAVFTVSAVVPQDQLAVSNMPEASSEALPGGLKRVRFQPSPRMSSYLLFFGLGDLERLTKVVDGTTVSVVIRRGQSAQARYALEAAEQLLPYYNAYFGRKYPLPKLDLVAAPGDVAGSMENWGSILFSQTNVVVDPKLSGAGDQQVVFAVVAHEMAHLWSGDLVTMAWWDDLWLNEGFASWMATKATDHFHPEWRYGLSGLADKDEAMNLDARGATHPIVQPVATVSQAEQAFDGITYKKGEAVIRMLEAYAGPDAWREGVRAYIAEHAYGNATSADLWRAIDKAAGKPVSTVARDFTTQPGVPLVSVSLAGDRMTLAQGGFTTDGGKPPQLSWLTPVRIQPLKGGPAAERLVSRGRPQETWEASVVNAGGAGYYRVSYDSTAFAKLASRFDGLPAADQFGLLKDTLALGMAGRGPISAYLRLTSALPAGGDAIVWREQARTLAGLDGFYAPGSKRAAYRAWAADVLEPVLSRVGFDERDGEPAADTLLRETLLLALGQAGDPRVEAEARRRFAEARTDLSRLAPGERRWVLIGAARSADRPTFEALRKLARDARDPLERNALYLALCAVEDESLAGEVLALSITDEAPSNMAPVLVREVAGVHPELAWRFTLANLPAITRTLDTLGRSTFVPRVAGASNDLKLALELLDYAKRNIPRDAQGEVQVALARIRNNADIQARRLPDVDGWISRGR